MLSLALACAAGCLSAPLTRAFLWLCINGSVPLFEFGSLLVGAAVCCGAGGLEVGQSSGHPDKSPMSSQYTFLATAAFNTEGGQMGRRRRMEGNEWALSLVTSCDVVGGCRLEVSHRCDSC